MRVTSPILDNEQQLITHGFSDDLDKAMRMAAEQMLWLLCEQNGMTADDAYSLCSVAIDLGVTQVVDRTLGCHAILNKAIFDV